MWTLKTRERSDLEGTPKMDGHHEIPLLLRHGSKRTIAQYTRVRHEDMHATKCVQGGLDDAIAVFCRTNDRCCLAASYESPVRVGNLSVSCRQGSLALPDFLAHGIGSLFANVVHDNVCSKSTIHESIGATKTRSGSGDDDSLATKLNG